MFVVSRASDGGGFLERHAAALRSKDVWLYSTGPIGGRVGRRGSPTAGECAVVTVGRAIGARGVAMFGTRAMADADDSLASLAPTETRAVRTWAAEIATELGATGTPTIAPRHGCQGLAPTR
jgi:hypothetical protein